MVRQFAPSVGGIEDVVLNLSRHQLASTGCDVRVVTLDRLFRDRSRRLPAEDRVEGIPVTRIPFAGSRRYPLAPAVVKCLGASDIVHVHGVDFFFDFLAWTKPLHKKTLVATTHGGFFHTRFATTLKRLYFSSVTRISARAYDSIIACSDNDAKMFEPIAPGRVVTIENGVDLQKLGGRAAPNYRRALLYFGRISANKRIHAIFPILRHLRTTSSAWHFTIAGREDDVTFKELQALAARAGVSDGVTFFREPSDRDLANLASEATYFVSPSDHEGFGIAVLEAMSAGLFPILSRIPPFEQFVRAAGVGLLIDPSEPEAASRAILDLDTRMMAGFAIDKQKLMRSAQTHDWSQVSDAYLAQYDAALGPRQDRSCRRP